jgi:hypothetical protein
MGLDINIGVNNDDIVFSEDYYNEENGNYEKHSLSREFCNFMSRQHVVEHEPELNQIGKITGVDISCLYEMETYPGVDEMEYLLETAESEQERQKIITDAEKSKEKLNGNIDKVLFTIKSLIEKLNNIDNLPNLLIATDFDTLNNSEYFSDFTIDKGQGYIDNNFGQDLRNFKRFLEYAKEMGSETVWFVYG